MLAAHDNHFALAAIAVLAVRTDRHLRYDVELIGLSIGLAVTIRAKLADTLNVILASINGGVAIVFRFLLA